MYPLIARFVIEDVGLELEDLITHAVELLDLPGLLEVVKGFVEGTRNMLHGARTDLKLSAAMDSSKADASSRVGKAISALLRPTSSSLPALPRKKDRLGVPALSDK